MRTMRTELVPRVKSQAVWTSPIVILVILACLAEAPKGRRRGIRVYRRYPALRWGGKPASQTLHRHFTDVVPPLTVVSRSILPVPHFEQGSGPGAERIGVRFAMAGACGCSRVEPANDTQTRTRGASTQFTRSAMAGGAGRVACDPTASAGWSVR